MTALNPPELAARRRRLLRLSLGIAALIALNIVAYWALGTPPAQRFLESLSSAVYVGALLLAFLANFTVLVPIPYNAIVLQMMTTADMPWLVAICSAAGSVVGETSGYLAGRAGKGVFDDTRFGRWMARQLTHPVRAFWVLVLVAAPPNPAFDVAGLAAGTLGVSWRIFYPAVFLGRLVRFLVFAAFAVWVLKG